MFGLFGDGARGHVSIRPRGRCERRNVDRVVPEGRGTSRRGRRDNLAVMYDTGKGVPHDDTMAMYWYRDSRPRKRVGGAEFGRGLLQRARRETGPSKGLRLV